ncbi:hypothetical protein [Dickeya chrysanthemi]|uniref:hypothetical protein n=1 Tax=Dickeya chrysanthemi TaxID=556 RepID=UPI001268F47D|nr:hypothetical protein [Dickeya chrysanthemi]MBX9444494.1 hypothetical protein [Dickeya chrysanthemi]
MSICDVVSMFWYTVCTAVFFEQLSLDREGLMVNNRKKEQATYAKPSRSDIVRSVATSTAVETGQPSASVEASLEAARKKFAHLSLA